MEHLVFAKKSHNLNLGNYNQFEIDDAKSKLQFMACWEWKSGAGKLINDQAYFRGKNVLQVMNLPVLLRLMRIYGKAFFCQKLEPALDFD